MADRSGSAPAGHLNSLENLPQLLALLLVLGLRVRPVSSRLRLSCYGIKIAVALTPIATLVSVETALKVVIGLIRTEPSQAVNLVRFATCLQFPITAAVVGLVINIGRVVYFSVRLHATYDPITAAPCSS